MTALGVGMKNETQIVTWRLQKSPRILSVRMEPKAPVENAIALEHRAGTLHGVVENAMKGDALQKFKMLGVSES